MPKKVPEDTTMPYSPVNSLQPDWSFPAAVLPYSAEWVEQAEALAAQLQLPCLPVQMPDQLEASQQVLWVHPQGLAIQQGGRKAPGPVRVDFVEGALAHRRLYGGGAGQQIAKAIGVKGQRCPQVLDATAGLGRDAFVLAALGCQVQMLERHPVVLALLQDGLQRAQQDPEVAPITARMQLLQAHAYDYMHTQAQQGAPAPQVIYLDPMFPHTEKSAEVKKDMKAFRTLVGADRDADALLAVALAWQPCRVVVKRPRKAPCLAGQPPSLSLEGKSGRFDVYALRSLDSAESP